MTYVLFILLSLILLPNHSLWLASANLEGLQLNSMLSFTRFSITFLILCYLGVNRYFSVCILIFENGFDVYVRNGFDVYVRVWTYFVLKFLFFICFRFQWPFYCKSTVLLPFFRSLYQVSSFLINFVKLKRLALWVEKLGI